MIYGFCTLQNVQMAFKAIILRYNSFIIKDMVMKQMWALNIMEVKKLNIYIQSQRQ